MLLVAKPQGAGRNQVAFCVPVYVWIIGCTAYMHNDCVTVLRCDKYFEARHFPRLPHVRAVVIRFSNVTFGRVTTDKVRAKFDQWAPSIKLESVESCALNRFMAVR